MLTLVIIYCQLTFFLRIQGRVGGGGGGGGCRFHINSQCKKLLTFFVHFLIKHHSTCWTPPPPVKTLCILTFLITK